MYKKILFFNYQNSFKCFQLQQNVRYTTSFNNLQRVFKNVPSLCFKNKSNFYHNNPPTIWTQTRRLTVNINDKIKPENAENATITVEYTEDEHTQEIGQHFQNPKNALNNSFDVLARDTQRTEFRLNPKFKLVKLSKNKSKWTCLYHLKWPQDIKCSASGSTKQEASHKAAIAALGWLQKNGKINQVGQLQTLDKKEVQQIRKGSIPTLTLHKDSVSKLEEIYNIHKNEFVPLLVESMNEKESDDSSETFQVIEPGDVMPYASKQKYLRPEAYLAKEKIELPITKYKEDFMTLLNNHNAVIVKGEPGCGKSTRIPQYVLESWFRECGMMDQTCRIVVTQPRRIAAISLAERVANERNEEVGSVVGYQVRLKSNFRRDTGRILYCTTGILLRHLQSDPNLKNFNYVILDEAHERDVNTDLLMNLLRTALSLNPKLKLIVMSATIDTEMFHKYFNKAPIIEIPGFTYPVQEYFADELKQVNLHGTLNMCNSEVPNVIQEDVIRTIKYIDKTKPEGAILCFLPGWDDISKISRAISRIPGWAVYCLHSRLQDSEQWKIFSKPPPGVRKIILTTNIAETSVTIDDVVYVIDTGIMKEKRFDIERGVTCMDHHWISKASATQRKGRAGRVQPGECYHLYSRRKFNSFIDYTLPEILRTSLTKIVLDAKVFSNNMDALQFMSLLPCPPEKSATIQAVQELVDLELLDDKENLTPLGKTVSKFQLEPKLSKAMVNSVVFKCMTPIVDIVTLFSSETEVFTSGLIDKEGVKLIKKQFCDGSDHLAMMRVFETWLELISSQDETKLRRFYEQTELAAHKLIFLEKLRKIHFDYLYNYLYEVLPFSDECSDNDELVKAVLYSGTGTLLKHRNWDIVKNRLKNNTNVFLTRHNQKATITGESVNYKRTKYPTDYLLYINETRSNIRRTTIIRESSLISNLGVLLFSNKPLRIKPAPTDENSSNTNSSVVLFLDGTNIEFICDRQQAKKIIQCKEGLVNCYQYYIQELTNGGDHNEELNSLWNSMLAKLNELLKENSV